jgi:hypothetical protein
MSISLTTPAVLPATEEKTYDIVWLSNLHVMAGDPNRPVRVMARLEKARNVTVGEGENARTRTELMPGGTVNVGIDDFFAAAAQDPSLLQLMGTIITILKTRANL